MAQYKPILSKSKNLPENVLDIEVLVIGDAHLVNGLVEERLQGGSMCPKNHVPLFFMYNSSRQYRRAKQ